MYASFGDHFRFGESSSELRKPAIWSEFLFKLGQAISASPENSTFLAILPTLKFAAPLVGSGFLYGQFNTRTLLGVNDNPIEAFRKLKKGAKLSYKTENGEQIATFEDFTTHNGQESIKILTSIKKGGCKTILTQDRLHLVTILSEETKSVGPRSIGKSISKLPIELKKLYGLEKETDFSDLSNRLQIFTRLGEFKSEQDSQIYKANKDKIPLKFTDLLRCNVEDKIDPPTFTNVFANVHTKPIEQMKKNGLVIFRGSQGYLRNAQSAQHARQILLFDYSDINLKEALSRFNEGYLERADKLHLNLELPPGVILSGFIRDKYV